MSPSSALGVYGNFTGENNATVQQQLMVNGNVTLNHDLTVSQGGISLVQNDITLHNGSITMQSGNITVQSGNLSLPIGQVSAATLSAVQFVKGYGGLFSGPVMINSTNFAVSSSENLRIGRGQVNYNGTMAAGSGFTVTHLGTGVYIVTFPSPFASPPVVTTTAINNSSDTVTAQIGTMSASNVSIGTRDAGVASDQAFTFIAIGN